MSLQTTFRLHVQVEHSRHNTQTDLEIKSSVRESINAKVPSAQQTLIEDSIKASFLSPFG